VAKGFVACTTLPPTIVHHRLDPPDHLLGHSQIVVAEDSEVRVLAGDERADLMVVEGKPRRTLGIQAQRIDARHLLAVVGQHASHIAARRHVEERDPRIESRDVRRIRADSSANS
jgi:hypothetical protein